MLETWGAKILVFVKFLEMLLRCVRARFYASWWFPGSIYPQTIILCGISYLCGILGNESVLASSLCWCFSDQKSRNSFLCVMKLALAYGSKSFWLPVWGQVRPKMQFQILIKVVARHLVLFGRNPARRHDCVSERREIRNNKCLKNMTKTRIFWLPLSDALLWQNRKIWFRSNFFFYWTDSDQKNCKQSGII